MPSYFMPRRGEGFGGFESFEGVGIIGLLGLRFWLMGLIETMVRALGAHFCVLGAQTINSSGLEDLVAAAV